MTLVELCAATASLSLHALARVRPLTGFMGSKARWARVLTDAMGCDRPRRVVLVDAGPWGDVWTVLCEAGARREVAAVFDAWSDERPHDLWKRLVALPPPCSPVERVAQYLWLQARSAGTIPMWWSAERGRWESPSGSRTEAAHARGGSAAGNRSTGPAHDRGAHVMGRRHRTAGGSRDGAAVGKPDHPGARGIQYPATVAARIRALDAIDWSRVEVVHGDVRSVPPIPGAIVLFDPPYLNAPRYAELLPRADVLDVARRWHGAGARVVVCEAEPVPLDGWTARPLPCVRSGKPTREWVTCSWPVRIPEQLHLIGPRAAPVG